MRVLATGGAGYVGSHAVRALLRAGHDVALLDDLSRGHERNVTRLGVELHRVDLRDRDAVLRALEKARPDAVLHFAGLALVGESVANPPLYWAVNFQGGLNLVAAMRRVGVRKLVVSSSAAVYGEPLTVPIAEDAPRAPVNPYGASKLAFEQALEREEWSSSLDWLALRYFNAAGASDEGDLGERHDPETHLVPNLVRAAREGTPFRLHGRAHPTRDGTCLRDLIHVEDLARAHVLALGKLGATHVRALNLGTGRGTTVLETVAAAERVLGRKVQVEDGPARPGDPPALVADPSRAEKTLGFKATRTLEDAIASHDRFVSGA